MTVLDFWHAASSRSRTALVCAALAVSLNLSSYAGLGISWGGSVFASLHLVILALGMLFLAQLKTQHRLAWEAKGMRPPRTPLPRRLIWGTVGATGYLLGVLIWFSSLDDENVRESLQGPNVTVLGDSLMRMWPSRPTAAVDARALRLFSAAWLFFAMMYALFGHVIEQRIRWYRRAGA